MDSTDTLQEEMRVKFDRVEMEDFFEQFAPLPDPFVELYGGEEAC